ncbi:hypothetical protein BUALT_Bualt02G0115300 [Buddleja alternifolia]|uniref:Ovate family protein n=1 Tax=Buddleja alternifolia TaxID=168488 RepID=A0AAV6Y102_9LAMI|nr:hypothetical protein BUALT_Bualt02G0115300 [Buddleja alternifolia]
MMIEEIFHRTKKLFHKTLRNLKSSLLKCRKNHLVNPKFPDSNKISSKFPELDNFKISFSKQQDSTEITKKKEADEQYGKSSIRGCGKVNNFKEKNESKCSRGYLAADHLAQKMKELEMMDMNDMDHVVDIEEVLHYYSHLKSPVYLEIVDNFFMDMYLEFHLPMPLTRSVNNSMRRMGSTRSVNSSMRKVGPASAHSSMRSLGPVKL